MLARRCLHSAVRTRVASVAWRPMASTAAPWRRSGGGQQRVASLEAKVQELRPKVTEVQQTVPELQGEVRQLAVQVTFRELTDVAEGLRGEFVRLREQIALVGQACDEVKSMRTREAQAVGTGESSLSSEHRELREQIAMVGHAYEEVSAMKKDLKNLREDFRIGRPPQLQKPTAMEAVQQTETDYTSRFRTSFEVSVSKLFPGGFGWQCAANVADASGLAANTFGFALATGVGDALGVGFGHTCYYLLKKTLYPEVDMTEQASLGMLLGSAAFISGTVWQPMVNVCGLLGLNFAGTFAVTGTVCGVGFYAGLRLFRALYSPVMVVAPPTYQNLVADAQLSVAIAGAAGTFTATDPSLAGNIYSPFIGVQDIDSSTFACVKAGASTWLGFLQVQAVQNVIYPSNRNWIDGGRMKIPLSNA